LTDSTREVDLLLTPTLWEPPATLESMTPVEDRFSALKAKTRGGFGFRP